MNNDSATEQLYLLFGRTQETLQQSLETHLGKPVSLVLTQNSTSMLSVRHRDGDLHVRLHRMFLHSDSGVVGEIAGFLKNKRGKMPLFRRFIRENRALLDSKPAKKITTRTAGKFFDLAVLYDEINQDYFEGSINCAITWGARCPRYSVRKRTLGSYSPRSNLIRINPVLDRKAVPRYYIAFVVYHELLHAALGIVQKGERRSMHTREFRTREKLFKEYERAHAWERGERTTSAG
jgi:predicted SprT family Zn-dependent metalloprotease